MRKSSIQPNVSPETLNREAASPGVDLSSQGKVTGSVVALRSNDGDDCGPDKLALPSFAVISSNSLLESCISFITFAFRELNTCIFHCPINRDAWSSCHCGHNRYEARVFMNLSISPSFDMGQTDMSFNSFSAASFLHAARRISHLLPFVTANPAHMDE